MTGNAATPTATTYAELDHVYRVFNAELFDGALPHCMLTLQRKKRTMGYFSSRRFGHRAGQRTDELALNPEYFGIVPLVEIMQTIAHEMVHLWQSHFGTPGRGRYHNEEWAARMESIGLMPSSTGKPGGRRTGDFVADYPAPGGKFLKACELLLTQAFTISWYDLFPPPGGFSGGHHDAVRESLLPAAADAALAIAISVQATESEGTSGASSPAGGAALSPAGANKSNRSKYACECERPLHVWGKPGLRISCMQCGAAFSEVSA